MMSMIETSEQIDQLAWIRPIIIIIIIKIGLLKVFHSAFVILDKICLCIL